MEMFSKSTENKFNDLLEKAYDAEKGFRKAAKNVDSATLKNFFTQKALEREGFKNELRNELLANGLKIKEDSGSATGFLHRAWMDTKALFSTDDDKSMLQEVRNGEKAALEDYEDLLEDTSLPASTVNILRKQRNVIESSYNRADYFEKIK